MGVVEGHFCVGVQWNQSNPEVPYRNRHSDDKRKGESLEARPYTDRIGILHSSVCTSRNIISERGRGMGTMT